MNMNKKGQKLTGGMVLLIGVVLVFAYTSNIGGFKDLLTPSAPTSGGGTVDNCPSSGLTEITINAQEALASTATNANVSYYVYDDGTLIKNGETGSDGTASFDVACMNGKSYSMLILNEKLLDGFYPQTVTVDATGPTSIHNLKVYQFGQVDVASIVAASDPTGNDSLNAGTGKNCGFTITFSENESASAFNKPLVMCLVNSTAVVDVTMTGATEVSSKKPIRISSPGNHQYYVFEVDKLFKSTDSAIKLSGKLEFSASASIRTAPGNNLSCIVVDQSTYRVAEYKTLSVVDGFVTAAENQETITDIGAPDSNRQSVFFNGVYC